MRVVTDKADRQWVGLVMVGALIILAVLLLQGVATAAGGEAQRVEQEGTDATIQVFAGARGSRIGISIEEVDSSEASASLDEGAVVTEVRSGTPADEAGFEGGDVVVEFDGERVRSARQLARLVQETPAGREVSATVIRDGGRQTLEVTPEAGPGWMSAFEDHLPDLEQLGRDWAERLPDMGHVRRDWRMAIPAGPRGFDFSGGYFRRMGRNRLGIEVAPVSPQLADYFGVDAGALVATVEPDSVASSAGLRAGDIITAINDDAVDSLASLRQRVANLEPGEAFTITVTRDGRELSMEGQIEETRSRSPRRQEAI